MAPVLAAFNSVFGNSGSCTRFTKMPPTGRSNSCSSLIPSRVSCTGISSSIVTRWTTVCGDLISRMIDSACRFTGPTRARLATSLLTLRNRAMRPVGGASITTAS